MDPLRLLARPATTATTAAAFMTILLALVPIQIHLVSKFMHAKDLAQSKFETIDDVYDFIIVGAGAAGSVVANRLSENPNHRVLLLERGGNPNPYTWIPYFAREYKKHPDTVHIYQTVRQKNAFKSIDGILKIPQGIGLGGSTNVNNMHFLRGSPSVYNEWANITGDSDWSFSSVLPFFKKIENYKGPISSKNSEYRSQKGPMQIEQESFHPSRSYLFSALNEKGYREADANAGGPEAKQFDPIQRNMKKGKRHGAYQSYIKPILRSRKNLKILRYAQVQKIHLDAKNRAKGVHFERHGKRHIIRARKEIIISAGPLESPKLLMLSGIGPMEHLEDMGIPLRVNLPVGQKHRDHTGVRLRAVFNETNISFMPDRDLTFSSVTDYLKYGTGPLRSPAGCFAMVFQSSKSESKLKPDIQFIIGGGNIYPGIKTNQIEDSDKDQNVIGILNNQPKSTGTLKLKSKDSKDDPIIDPNSYSDPADIQVVLDAIDYAIDIYEGTETYKKLNATIKPSPESLECNKLKFRSKAYWECYVRDSNHYALHPCCSCSMGRGKNDPNAVLDSKLRVIGTKNLRVIDSSIMPRISNVNTMVPTLMIGERGSDFILRYWEEKERK